LPARSRCKTCGRERARGGAGCQARLRGFHFFIFYITKNKRMAVEQVAKPVCEDSIFLFLTLQKIKEWRWSRLPSPSARIPFFYFLYYKK
jgi:hypothetical protein